MPRGGKRPGAGRPKGRKDDVVAAKQLAVSQALGADLLEALDKLGDGYTSLDLLQAIYRNRKAPLDARFAAAAKALPHEVAKPTANKQAGSGGIVFKLGRHGAAAD